MTLLPYKFGCELVNALGFRDVEKLTLHIDFSKSNPVRIRVQTLLPDKSGKELLRIIKNYELKEK